MISSVQVRRNVQSGKRQTIRTTRPRASARRRRSASFSLSLKTPKPEVAYAISCILIHIRANRPAFRSKLLMIYDCCPLSRIIW